MLVTLINRRRIRIKLSEHELVKSGLTPEITSDSGEPLWQSLSGLLSEARRQAGVNYSYSRMLIEYYPNEDGGATLYLNGLGSPKIAGRLRIKRILRTPILAVFKDKSALLAACRAVRAMMSGGSSELYKTGGGRLILSLCPALHRRRAVGRVLPEFCDELYSGRLLHAVISEHSLLINKPNAVEAISGAG